MEICGIELPRASNLEVTYSCQCNIECLGEPIICIHGSLSFTSFFKFSHHWYLVIFLFFFSVDWFNVILLLIGKICDAVEVAGKNVMSTSSTVTTGLVSHR